MVDMDHHMELRVLTTKQDLDWDLPVLLLFDNSLLISTQDLYKVFPMDSVHLVASSGFRYPLIL